MTISIILVIVSVLLRAPHANADVGPEEFSSDQIEADVRRFSAVVLESDLPPSLSDYASFHGVHRESEYERELAYCVSKLKTAPFCTKDRVEPVLSDECKKWWKERPSRSESAPSLFYEALRHHVRVSPGSLRLGSQVPSNAEGVPIILIQATALVNGRQASLEFWHWPNPKSADSLVGLLRLDDRDIETEILAEAARRICPSTAPARKQGGKDN